MENIIGKVIEVFIPNNNINSKEIGFKILINNKLIDIIEEQDEYNSNIYKNDLVIITKTDNSYDLEKFNGDIYE